MNNYDKGNSYFKNHKYEEAIKYYTLAMKDNSSDVMQSRINYNIGACMNILDKYELSIEYLKEALNFASKYEPDYPLLHEIYYTLGLSYYNLKNYQKALLYFNSGTAYDGGRDTDCEDGYEKSLKRIIKDDDPPTNWINKI